MDEIPIQVFIMPVIAIAAVVGMMFWRKKMVAQTEQTYANFRVGQLAARLRLHIVEGDPNLNLMMTAADPARQRTMKDGEVYEQRVRLAGQPLGHPVELIYFNRLKCETGFSGTTWHTWFDCRITVKTGAQYPDFEVLSRTTSFGRLQQKLPLPPQTFGNLFLDQQYVIASADARVGPVLGGVMGVFAPITVSGVHLLGEQGSVSFLMTETNLSSAIYHVETIIQGLEAVARALGSQPPT